MSRLCEEKTCAVVCTVLLIAVIILATILIFLWLWSVRLAWSTSSVPEFRTTLQWL